MELHHWAMLALIAVAVLGSKIGRALTLRDFQRRQQKVLREMDARKCAREVRRVQDRGQYLDLDTPCDDSLTVGVMKALREEKITFAAGLDSQGRLV